ncbi:TrmB family transcriptional regulator [Nanoarchaeota archaeon]
MKEILKDLGFETREIKVYLELIKNNTQPALKISKATRIDRTTIYDILERLKDKGIISQITKNNTKHYTALTPKGLTNHFREKYSSLEHILPKLNKIATQTKEPVNCEFFQGKEGLKTAVKDIINAKKDYKVIGIRKEYEDIIGYLNEQGVIKLNRFNVKEKGIVEKGIRFKKVKKGEYRYLKVVSPITTLIYGTKVVFFIWTEPYFAVRVNSKTFAKGQEEYFDLLWKIAE